MNHILAKLKGKESQLWKIMSQSDEIFTIPDLSVCHEFSPQYKLDEGEWYKLTEFSTKGFNNPLLKAVFNSTEYNQLIPESYNKIVYLCCKQNENLLFQKVSKSQVLRKKWFQINSAPKLENSPIIILNNYLDAIYNTTSDTLYFRDFSKLGIMFNGIEALYREATQKEVQDFLSNDFIAPSNRYSADSVKTANRKRIAIVIDKLQQYSEDNKKEIFKYISEYCKNITVTSDGKFQISSEEDLKLLIFGIEERYYTTKIGNEKRLANSIQTIGTV